MILAFRSTLSGLSKLSRVDPPSEADIEKIVVQGFEGLLDEGRTEQDAESDGIDVAAFVRYCLSTPEIMSWIDYYDDIDETVRDVVKGSHMEYSGSDCVERTVEQETVMAKVLGGLKRLECERKGLAYDILPPKSWQNALPSLAPSRPPVQSDGFPAHSFSMRWVYGYNAHTYRNTLHYTASGAIIYPAGAVCVTQDVFKRSQQHFTLHTDLITCMQVFLTVKGKSIVASGECGRRPAVHVWDSDSRELLCSLQGFHSTGILHIDMSPDRSKIAIMGMDKHHCITVDNWVLKQRIWASRSTAETVNDFKFLSPTLIAAVGKNHFTFFAEKKGGRIGYDRYRGIFGCSVAPEVLWCVCVVGSMVVTGSASGRLFVWEGRNLVDSVKGHSSPLLCCHAVDKEGEGGLISGCSGGKIIIWTAKLEIGALFNVSSLGSIHPSIASINWDKDSSKILIGFKSCEVYEIDSLQGRNMHNSAVVTGHYHLTITGLSMHPMNPRLVCTVGADKTIRVTDTEQHRQILSVRLDTVGACCAYSIDAQLILVGFGSNGDGEDCRKEGAYVILSEEDLTIVYEARDSKSALTACGFSPDGQLYALSSSDGIVYVYSKADYTVRAVCRGHAGGVSHLDFSQDSRFLMTNSTAAEVFFWDLTNGEAIAPKVVKDVKWATNTCIHSYATQGLSSLHDDGVVCVSACRSHSRDIVAMADSCGRVRVASAPCVKSDPSVVLLLGHACDVRACAFSCNDSHMYSIGSCDGTMIQWQCEPDALESSLPDSSRDIPCSQELAAEIAFRGKVLDRTRNAENVLSDIPVALCLLEEGEDNSTGLQPWQKTIVSPSLVPPEDSSEPPDSLSLEFIYGFTVDRSRQSLMHSAEGELIFFAGSVVVLMDVESRQQRFYNEHQACVSAVAASSLLAGALVASSDIMEAPCIRIWSALTLQTLAVLHGFHRRGVNHLKFSSDGSRIATMGMDRMQSWAVYSWRNNQILSCSQSFSQKSLCMDFTPSGDEILQCGDGIIRFWSVRDRNVSFQDAILGVRCKVQAFLCIGWIGNNAVVGADDGCLYRFVGKRVDGSVKAHTGAVNGMSSSSEGLCTCSSDGYVKTWSNILDCKLSIDLKTFPVTSRNIRCISWGGSGSAIAVGTSHGEILEINSLTGDNVHPPGALLMGHGGDELWGISVHPTKDQFCTVGEDSVLRMWDIETHCVIASSSLEMASRCCSFSPDGRRVAVGFGSPFQSVNKQYDGKWVVVDAESFEVLHEARDSASWLSEAKHSPNGEILAFGSSCGAILIYSVQDSYSLTASVDQHKARIVSLDFSQDSRWMQSSCVALELMFYEADTGMHMPAASKLRDTVWSSQHSPLGWAVQGIWPPQSDGTESTACESNLLRGSDGPIAVSGDSYGGIQLFRSPCVSAFSASKRYRVSSNAVCRIRFCTGDSRLLTVSPADKVVVQWVHRRDRAEEVVWDVAQCRGNAITLRADEDRDITRLIALTTEGADGDRDADHIADKALAVSVSRPWLAAAVPPSNLIELTIDSSMPKQSLERHHMFGLETYLSRASVRYNCNGDYVFPTSKYVCLFNKKKNVQTVYRGHSMRDLAVMSRLNVMSTSTAPDGLALSDEDSPVCCVSVSADGQIVASATQCSRPNIHVWDASSCVSLCVLQLLHRRGVICMQFSPDGRFLASVGSDQDHSLALWESPSSMWTDGRLLACSKGDPLPVMFCSFYQYPSSTSERFLLVTGGKFHQKFWSLDGRVLNSTYPEHDSKEQLGTLLCGAVSGENFLSGSSRGVIHVWLGRKLVRSVLAHDAAVTCLWSGCGVGVLSASRDGAVKLWTSSVRHVRSYAISDADVPPIDSAIRSLDVMVFKEEGEGYAKGTRGGKGKDKGPVMSVGRVLMVTESGEMYEMAGKSGSITIVHEAHSTGQLHGLSAHPSDSDLFASCGDDRTVRVWSVSLRRLLRKAVLDCTARCLAWSGDGRNILVGMGGSADGKRQKKDGAWLMLNADTLKPLFEGR